MGSDDNAGGRIWRPWTVREDPNLQEEWDVLLDGLPDHVLPAVDRWVSSVFQRSPDRRQRLGHLLKVGEYSVDASTFERAWRYADEDSRLNVLDGALHILGSEYNQLVRSGSVSTNQAMYRSTLFDQLVAIFTEGSCLLVPVEEDEIWALRRRVSEEQGEAFEQASSSSTSSAAHLRTAWRACFRRDADPSTAYRESVLAVEGAVGAALTPRDGRPSLGKVVAHLEEAASGAYTLAGLDRKGLLSVDTVLAMLRTLQRNDRRHARPVGHDDDPVTQDEAEAVVFLAVTLVRWFEQGLVRKVGGASRTDKPDA